MLHTLSAQELVDLRAAFLQLVLVNNLRFPDAVLLLLKTFLLWSSIPDFEFVDSLLQSGRQRLAQWVVKHRVRKHLQLFQSDVIGIASRPPA